MAVLAPMPSEMVRITVAAKPGDLRNWRRASFRSYMGYGREDSGRVSRREDGSCRLRSGFVTAPLPQPLPTLVNSNFRFADGISSTAQVGETHLGILAR